jgi:2-polyprenyl-3-methyl-5-hydroxy-6-metoxy-1,4-benzoquinol methylase
LPGRALGAPELTFVAFSTTLERPLPPTSAIFAAGTSVGASVLDRNLHRAATKVAARIRRGDNFVDLANVRATRAALDRSLPSDTTDPPTTQQIFVRDHRVSLTALGNGKRRLYVDVRRKGAYVRRAEWDTNYSDELVHVILNAKGPGSLCDEIKRDEDPQYLRPHLALTVTAHVDPAELAGAEVLDFGCGAGASTVILSQLLPASRITGVELRATNLEIARARAAFYGLTRATFLLSPSGNLVPQGIGPFRAIVLSAVFEHLLPTERESLLPALWRLLAPGGVLFLDETPARWFPIETHTTGLPLINYLPDQLAAAYARRFSKRIHRNATWDQMRRDGIRGSTVTEILELLPADEGRPILIEPRRLGVKGPLDLWIRGYTTGGSGWRGGIKRATAALLAIAAPSIEGAWLVPYLSLAIRKAGT